MRKLHPNDWVRILTLVLMIAACGFQVKTCATLRSMSIRVEKAQRR